MKKFAYAIYAVVGGVLMTATPALCAIDLSTYTVDTASVETMGGIVLLGLGVLWGLRKLIKTINRS